MSKTPGIGKTGSKWWYIISAGYDTNGKQIQKRKRGFSTKKDAMEARTKALNELMKGTFIEPNKTLYKDFITDWLENRRHSIKKQTVDNYVYIVNCRIAPALGDYPLQKISAPLIQSFLNEMRAQKLSPTYLRKMYDIINSSLKTAVKWKLIGDNPAAAVDPPRRLKKEITVWNADEIWKFLDAAGDDRLYTAFFLAVSTGMRQCEILALRWRDIDFETGTLTIRQILSHDGKAFYAEAKTKSSIRSVIVPEELIPVLVKQRKLVVSEKLAAGVAYEDHDLVICTKRGTAVSPRNALRSMYRLMKKAGVPKIRFHDQRHTHATLLLQENVNAKVVAERLGHSTTRMTLDTYSHVLPNMQREAAEGTSRALFKSKNALTV